MPEARAAYEAGMPLAALRRRFNMSHSELQDVAPEEFVERPKPEGKIGGY